MPDRATVTEVRQIGVEALATPGVAVPATKLLQAMNIAIATKAEIDAYRPDGQKYGTVAILNKEWAEGAITGKPTYNEIVYPLASVLTDPVISVPGGGTLTRDWDFAPSSTGPDSGRTFTVEQGVKGAAQAERAVGVKVRELRLMFSRNGGVDMSGSAIGERMTEDIALTGNESQSITLGSGPATGGTFTLSWAGQTTAAIAWNASAATVQAALEALSNIAVGDVVCTGGPLPATAVLVEFRGVNAQSNVAAMTADAALLTPASTVTIATPTPGAPPTALALVPIAPGECSVYLDPTSANIGVTKLLRDFVFEWQVGNRYNPIWPLNAALTSYDDTIEAVPTTSVKLTMGNDAVGRALLPLMRLGSSQYVRLEAIGPLIEGALYHRLRIDACIKVTSEPAAADIDGLAVLVWEFQIFHDATWGTGKAYSVHVRNPLTAL